MPPPFLKKPLQSLSFKLSVAFALVVFSTVSMLSVYLYIRDRRNELAHEQTDLQILSAGLATRIDRSLAGGKGIVVHLSCTRDVQEYVANLGRGGQVQETFQHWLDLQVHQTPEVATLSLLSPDGVYLASSDRALLGQNRGYRPYFQEAMAGRSFVSDWTLGAQTRVPHIYSSAPVRLGGRIAGVLVAGYPVDEVEQAIRAVGIQGRTAVLINRAGIAIAHSNPLFQYHSLRPVDGATQAEIKRTRQFMDLDIPADPVSANMAEALETVRTSRRQQTLSYQLGSSEKMACLTPLLERDWVISVAIPEEAVLMPIHRAMQRTLLVGLATVLAGIIAGIMMGRALLGPLRRLAEAMGRFGDGDAAARAPVLDQDERGRLAQSFNAMASALQAHQEHLEELVKGRTLELSRSEERFRLAMEATSDGLWDWYIATGEVYYSPAYTRMLGYEPEEFRERIESWTEMIVAEDRARVVAVNQECIDGLCPAFEVEYRIRTRDGATKWILGRGRVVSRGADGRALRMIGTHVDITERRQAEAERRRLEERVSEIQRLESLGVLVAGVAHNFNNLLAVLMGTASLREEFATDPLDIEAYQTISRVCRRGRDVVKALSHFGEASLASRNPVELNGLLGEACLLLGQAAGGVRVRVEVSGEPLWINGDADNLNHALANVYANALDAMPAGGTLTLSAAARGEHWVELTVTDDGAGMAPEVLARALDPFFSTKEVGKGTGLGLSVAYGVAKAHGGTLELASRPGHGTTVTFRLPRIPAPAAPVAPAPAPSLDALSVLLVDDDEDVRFLLVRMLRKAGVERVVAVAGGEEALASLGSGPLPDLVILDQNMPGMDGVQTLALIRNRYPVLPVLISSGQPDIAAWDCFRQPGVGVVAKPFNQRDLHAKLIQFCRLG